jgi:hypothetical protein
MPMIRKSGIANRAADLRIDAVARESAQAVRAAGNPGATERFLGRFLDHLHEADNRAYGVSDADLAKLSRRRRRRSCAE